MAGLIIAQQTSLHNIIENYLEESILASLTSCESNMRLQKIIENYPEEMLLQIFGFLDLKSLKNLTLVNKRWHNIVTNETSTMKNLPIIICGDILSKKSIVGNWKFYKVVFKSIFKNNCYDTKMLSSLETIGETIREIEFIQCCVSKPEYLKNILKIFPNVEKLTFKRSWFTDPFKKLNAKVLNLKHLKQLVVKQHNLTMFSCIEVQLNSLKVNILPYRADQTKDGVYRNEQLLMEFIYSQKQLKTLALRNIFSSTTVFAKKGNTVYQFKLKELSLLKMSCEEGFEDENLKDFLFTQKDSVELLELGGTFSNDVYYLILNKFENVQTLRIDISAFPDDISFYKRVRVKNNVTNLMIYGENGDVVKYCTILSIFPNVTDISFSSEIPFEVLSSLPNCCNVLTSLSLYTLCRGNYKNLMFSALKNLHLERVGEENEWSDFLMSNQTIESLSLQCILRPCNFLPEEPFGQKLKMIRETLQNLKQMKFGDNMKVNMSGLQNIVDIFKNLESSGFKFCSQETSSVNNVSPIKVPVWRDDMEFNDPEDDKYEYHFYL